jgi:CRP/FNR family transcriptional regulator
LLARARQGQTALKITHQELAVELGTAREVISRLLKELERKGLVHLARGRVEVTGLLSKPATP